MPYNYDEHLLNEICSSFSLEKKNSECMEKVFLYCQSKKLIIKEGKYEFGYYNFYEIGKNGDLISFFNGKTWW